MAFFLLELCSADCPLAKTLWHTPNGTPLSGMQLVRTQELKDDLLVYWIEDELAFSDAFLESVQRLKDVKRFTMLQDLVPRTIRDEHWKWDDAYINRIMLPAIAHVLGHA
jgi:hypothetical protein